MDQVKLYYALILAIAMGLGGLFSGVIVDKLGKKNPAAYALVPAAAMALCIPFFIWFLKAPSWQSALAILAIPTFLNFVYLAPALAVVQNGVRPSQRTMSGALLLMILNLIGLGLGPTFIGWLSTYVYDEKLSAALMWLVPVYVIAVVFFLLQARALSRETVRTY